VADVSALFSHPLSVIQNLDLPYGQHRWVEYKNIHNYDATMIQPE
jgi:hypothetical protein